MNLNNIKFPTNWVAIICLSLASCATPERTNSENYVLPEYPVRSDPLIYQSLLINGNRASNQWQDCAFGEAKKLKATRNYATWSDVENIAAVCLPYAIEYAKQRAIARHFYFPLDGQNYNGTIDDPRFVKMNRYSYVVNDISEMGHAIYNKLAQSFGLEKACVKSYDYSTTCKVSASYNYHLPEVYDWYKAHLPYPFP